MLRFYIPFLLFILLDFALKAQNSDIPYQKYPYQYINYERNIIQFPGDSTDFEHLWTKFDNLIRKGEGKINVVHFGGSHIQAGIYSGQTRKQLQNFYPGLNGGRGLIFPFVMGRSRGPKNYSFHVTGDWKTCVNVGRNACHPGLLGIQGYTSDVSATIKSKFSKEYQDYDFNRIKVFHELSETSFKLSFPDSLGAYTTIQYPDEDYTEVFFDRHLSELVIKFEQETPEQSHFVLYGISFENDDPGIVYHDAGINGASLPSFIKCSRLENQMRALQPDLVIISLGTNDTYTKKFDPEYYRANYEQFTNIIKKAAPNTAVLMTVPNDCYFKRRYPNKNTIEAERVILETAKKMNCGVWDFYEIMGGLNSSYLWHKDGLMVYDRIHFTGTGYLIKGNLFFWALLKSYDAHIEKQNQKNVEIQKLRNEIWVE